MKALKIIQVLAKILRIVCVVVFICCIVGAAMCALALILVPVLKDTVLYDGKTLEIILADKTTTVSTAIVGSVCGLIACGVGIFLAKHTELFLNRELELGTPFKMEIVKRMRRVALVHIIASVAAGVALAIAYCVGKAIAKEPVDINMSHGGSSIGFGLALLVISLFCEYGADDKEEKDKPEVKSL